MRTMVRVALVGTLACAASGSACASAPRAAGGAEGGAERGAAGTVVADVTAAEAAFADVVRRSDATAAARLLAADFTFVGLDPSLPATSRAAWYDNLASGRVTTDSVAMRDLRVTPVGADSATATLRFTWRPILSGLPVRLDVAQVEDSWARRDGRWQITRRRVLSRDPAP